MLKPSISIYMIFIFTINPSICEKPDNDIFSSVKELSKLVKKEDKFFLNLETLTIELEKKVSKLRRYLKFNKPRRGVETPEEYVSNPVNSIALVKRLGLEMHKYGIHELLAEKKTLELQTELNSLIQEFPKMSDFSGAANGIHLLQEHYRLNISLVAEGIIEYENQIFKSEHTLGADELTEIGMHAANAGFYDSGVDWLQLARIKYHTNRKNGELFTETTESIDSRLRDAIKIHDHWLETRGVVGETHRCNHLPFNTKLRKKKKYREARKSNSWRKAEKSRNIFPLYTLVKDAREHSLR
ncbi:prolyl 4-hydroxylase subunit alpha-3 [Eurytemora carolleeae]|uniref:prolyl 4-hydroxylase subunit alpha-3 n=1 Tax=Eurytemora carolleeae TaxID=1294199 RepID=UPI000C7604BC|nr:prolyl 4-hydroxylase subunit alpha-3 [Eurytemora carolleeae]|eukprot:XP_023321781.1 prolyl 4-hydroxylase subunit alpha-3-like [Eurytemora affinis]